MIVLGSTHIVTSWGRFSTRKTVFKLVTTQIQTSSRSCHAVLQMSASFLSACVRRAADSDTDVWELIKRSGQLAICDFGPNKGLGVVALRSMVAGEMLLRETPLLRLKPNGQGQFYCAYAHGKPQSETLINTLSQHSYGRGLDEVAREAMTVVERVIETNAFIVTDGTTCVFLEISRFNHSCSASARFAWDASDACGTVICKEDIPQGAEITINYGAKGSLDKRQQYLFERFSFGVCCFLSRTLGI